MKHNHFSHFAICITFPLVSFNPSIMTFAGFSCCLLSYCQISADLFLLKNQDFSFLTHDSVLKLNDIRTVS